MENVWAVAVNEHSGVVVVVKRVSGDVRPAVDEQRPLPRFGQLSSQRRAGEACAHDDRLEAADRLPAPGPRLTLTIRDGSLHEMAHPAEGLIPGSLRQRPLDAVCP